MQTRRRKKIKVEILTFFEMGHDKTTEADSGFVAVTLSAIRKGKKKG